jgi:Zn-dependent peptidase ImmA (M78 family)/transcriptional regulator with XRE-family HTH domain
MSPSASLAAASAFDPLRLRIARQHAMLTKKALAERVGVTAAAVSQFENGSTSPAAKTAAKLALALGMPVDFFVAGRDLGEAPTTEAHFRSLRSTTRQERDRAFTHALMSWEVARIIQRYVRFPTVALPSGPALASDADPSEVEVAAQLAREELGVGLGPIPNVVRLLESRGVVCTRIPAQTRRVYAFSCGFPDRPVVVLSAERAHRAAGRFDASHELAHLVLHPDAEPGTHAVERQANAFAAEFLAPSSEIADLLPRRADWSQLIELKSIWGISIQALLFRARTLRVMPENVYRRAVTQLNAMGWRTQEPGDDGRAEEPMLLTRAIEIAADQGVTIDDLAAEARLPVDTIRQIVNLDVRPSLDL